MDFFSARTARPMLIGAEGQPFDDPEWIFELKLDGERCLAYLDHSSTVLINRRSHRLGSKFPELADLNRQVGRSCLLDGELVITVDGRPDFEAVLRRSGLSGRMAVELAARRFPVTFVAFDLLYLDQDPLINRPLGERKELLADSVADSERLAVARYIENQGRAFFEIVRERGLEGLIAKKRDSRYYPGQTTKDWVKIKNLLDDDFIICGYVHQSAKVASLVLGQYKLSGSKDSGRRAIFQISREMSYKGHVTVSLAQADFKIIAAQPRAAGPPFRSEPPAADRAAVWIQPALVCKVKFLARTARGKLRQPVYVGLRSDKTAEEAVEYLWKP